MSEDELYVRTLVPKIRIQQQGKTYHIRGHEPPNYSFYEQGANIDQLFKRVANRIKTEFTISNDRLRA